jgi:hypothetical protein
MDAFVSEAAASRVEVKVLNEEILSALEKLGFVPVINNNLVLVAEIPNQEAKAQTLSKLRDIGVCFSGGADWSPSEVFEYLRDMQLVTGLYRKVIWKGPSRMEVIENV